jgi:hypothetical protein
MIHEAAVRTEQDSATAFRPRPRSAAFENRAAAPGAGHDFGAICVLDQSEAEEAPSGGVATEPLPVPEPVPMPAPTPEPEPMDAPSKAPVVTIPRIRPKNNPAGAPDRIPPRVDTEVDVAVKGASADAPVKLMVDGQGGGNGTVKVDGGAGVDLADAATVKLRGNDQTDDAKQAGKLQLVARQGTTELARSKGFSVAAYPTEIGFKFFSLMSPAEIKGDKVWGARYDLTVESDSKVRGDLDRTKIAENVLVKSATGIFKGAENKHSDFHTTTLKQRDHHGTGTEDNNAAGLIAEVKKAGVNKSKQVSNQFYRFACLRTGIAEDKEKAPKVPTSGFKIQHRTSAAEAKYFMNITKTGLKHSGVAAGTVDDSAEKAAEIKD